MGILVYDADLTDNGSVRHAGNHSGGIRVRSYKLKTLAMRDVLPRNALTHKNVMRRDRAKLLRKSEHTEKTREATRSTNAIHAHIARALARGYTDLYYVNMETDELIEYHTDDELGVLTEARRSDDFFEGCKRDVKLFVHPDDQEAFVNAMNREFLTEALDKSKVFEMSYRRIIGDRPLYVNMKVSRVEDDKRFIVIAVSDIDELMKKRRAEERIREERIIYARLHALTGNFIVVYVVDPKTDQYREFSATADYEESFAQAKEGESFFDKVREVARTYNHPDDLDLFLSAFTKENVMAQVERNGIFTFSYRLMMENGPVHVQMKAALVEEQEGMRLIVGLNDVDAQVRQQEEFGRRLAQAQIEASRDALTGVKNKHAYLEAEALLDRQIKEHRQSPFAITILDVNDLKKVNDTAGHQAGDQRIRDACMMICDVFKHSPVFRIGGDEFAVISQRHDYEHIEELLGEVDDYNAQASRAGDITIACGMSKFDDDACVATVFERADRIMYENKSVLKSNDLREEAVLKRYIIDNFDTAIREKWIRVYLQPIVRTVNERVSDVEALARWIDPEKGVLSPASFIPALEDAGQIYRLDLYMVEQVLECIKTQIADGFEVIPHSINLSRCDFDACDIVEEVRKRVDAAGINRDRITIEITESVIGSDFEFMKEQIERFKELGFPVWLDDFGSGYSSLDVLQSIKFDLIKFDMSFMRKLDEGESGKVIMTELMRMATSLGVGTVCEGVETESQVRFLQEIGCSKLQGFFFRKPVPFETIRHMHNDKTLIENENPGEAGYYESMGRVNLYDLGVIAQGNEDSIQNTFNTLPMGIIEIRGDSTRFVRSNQSYRDFIKRFFGLELSYLGSGFAKFDAAFMKNVVETCCEQGLRSFYDEKMPDGSIVHSFARQIGTNPITGDMAVVIAVLSVAEPDEGTSYADIARALAADYYNLFVVDLDTESYVEYSSLVGGEELALERHGMGFFESARRDAMTRVFENDRKQFLSSFSKENVLHELETQGVFTMTYRLIDTGAPVYANMKITRMQGGNRIIMGISNIDAQMRQQEEEKRLRRERTALGRIAALSSNYIVLYTVDPVTGHYTQYNPSNEFEQFGLAKQGEDFFADVRTDAPKAIDPRDLERHLRIFTKDNMMREIQESGHFVHNYHLLINGEPIPASLKATLVEEDEGERIILGVSIAS